MGNGDFDRALTFVLKHEGGLVDDKDDTGGLTNLGISIRAHPELSREEIKTLTPQKAGAIYRKSYWSPISGDNLPWPLCLAVFDTAVNMGVSRALSFLSGTGLGLDPKQRAQIVVNQRRAKYDDLIRQRPVMKKYRKGWMTRLADLEKLISAS